MFARSSHQHFSILWTGSGVVLAIIAFSLSAACKQQAEAPRNRQPEEAQPRTLRLAPETAFTLRTLSPIPQLPRDPTNRFADDPAAAHFGQFLFFDTALSGTGAISCATCHRPQRAFTDGLAIAIANEIGNRNTPSLINAAFYPWLNWDGSADTTWSQALGPLEAEHELGSTRTTIAKLIGTDQARRAAYEAIFGPLPDPAFFHSLPDRATPAASQSDLADSFAWNDLTDDERHHINTIFVNIGKSIGAYQRKLIAADSAFDRFASTVHEQPDGEWIGLSVSGFDEIQLRGLELFAGDAGCIACHTGPFFTDFSFHSVRVPPIAGGAPTDPGRYGGLITLLSSPFNSAGEFSDDPQSGLAQRLEYMRLDSENWGLFRTPSLRNVAMTAPYMHSGQFESLERVIVHYSTFEDALPPDHHTLQNRLLQPLRLSRQQISELVAFLESLTDVKLRPDLLQQPESPISDAS